MRLLINFLVLLSLKCCVYYDIRGKYQPVSVTWLGDYCFFRKGVIGDHVNYFNDRHHNLFERMVMDGFPNLQDIDEKEQETPADGADTWFKSLHVHEFSRDL